MQAPTPPARPILPGPGQVIIGPGVYAPSAVYRAFNEQRRELANQLETLEGKRRQLTSQIHGKGQSEAGKAGLETRIAEIDKRIADLDNQLSAADLSVAKAAAVPNAILPERPPQRSFVPKEVFVLSGMFIMIVFLPLSMALARRIWKRGAAAVVAFPQELADRLNRLDQSVDSIAIEVERIGEGQRFLTRIMSDSGVNRALGGGAAMPIDVGSRAEKVRAAREGERGQQ